VSVASREDFFGKPFRAWSFRKINCSEICYSKRLDELENQLKKNSS
jgi:hypothetical protein